MHTNSSRSLDFDSCLTALSRLTLCLDNTASTANADAQVSVLRAEIDTMLDLAHSNHVLLRAFPVLSKVAEREGDESTAHWANAAIARESRRIENAISHLQAICNGLQNAGHRAVVIKSLDHWPDLGSDLDLYTDSEPEGVIHFMKTQFHAKTAARSWGDRLANKWNFLIPGLPESVEIHMGRLGQTGEQVTLASSLLAGAQSRWIGNRAFNVPAAEDRFMISTLQRMYRHFYVRLCDIVDNARLVEEKALDYDELRSSAQANGIWEGVATYLRIISDYVAFYRGYGLELPATVLSAARFGGEKIRFARSFLRIPILPYSARLYASELTTLFLNGELRNTARLSLLPCLATAAAVGQKLTGSDKGIW